MADVKGFIVFGAVLMALGAGDLLMKTVNRLTGRFTGGAAHATVASMALFGTLSGATISNVLSTCAMTIPVIKKSGFKPALFVPGRMCWNTATS